MNILFKHESLADLLKLNGSELKYVNCLRKLISENVKVEISFQEESQ